MRKIAFIDRDGTLLREPPDEQIDSLEKFELVDGVIPALLRLREAGYRLVVVSNQDGLGSARYPRPLYDLVQSRLCALFASQGIEFDEVLVCPHTASDGCTCRKPHLGLVRPLLTDRGVDLQASVVVGDRESDLEFARNMGVRGFRLGPSSWKEVADAVTSQPRTAQRARKTAETDVRVAVDLDRPGRVRVDTGIGFFDHMLEQLAKHGGFSMTLEMSGDLEVDAHHSVEDAALCLGETLKAALGDRFSVGRYGFVLPMDEARATVALDLSGRPLLAFAGAFRADSVGGLPTQMVPHFFRSLADSLGATLQLELAGDDDHHKVEAAFKGVGRALRAAAARTAEAAVPSTKGTL